MGADGFLGVRLTCEPSRGPVSFVVLGVARFWTRVLRASRLSWLRFTPIVWSLPVSVFVLGARKFSRLTLFAKGLPSLWLAGSVGAAVLISHVVRM